MYDTEPLLQGRLGLNHSSLMICNAAADARTYYSRLQINHGMEFEEAQQYRDDYIQDKRNAGLQVSDRNGFYMSSTIKDQGKTGSLHTLCHQSRQLYICC